MVTAESFLSEIDAFLTAKGMSESAFGKAALGDPNFVSNLRAGRSPSLKTVSKVADYLRTNAPAEAGVPQ
jgi:hypothetical protein